MSEADRVFSRREEQAAQTSSSEKRLIITPPRKGGFGGGKSRVVEVVHVQRDRSKPTDARSHPARSNVRAETWPEGFRAKAPSPPPRLDIQPATPEAVQPAVHVMAMWEPSPQQPAQPEAKPAEMPVETAVATRRKPRVSKPNAPHATARRFADPFSDDGGANCIRCGYLVEQAREKRGLMTCSQCG